MDPYENKPNRLHVHAIDSRKRLPLGHLVQLDRLDALKPCFLGDSRGSSIDSRESSSLIYRARSCLSGTVASYVSKVFRQRADRVEQFPIGHLVQHLLI